MGTLKGRGKGSKSVLDSGGRAGKRMLAAREIMQKLGQNPIENMARIAAKAEHEKDYPTALRGWAEIQTYLEPRRKPVDPAEIKDLQNRAITLEELQKMKLAIMAGVSTPIPEHTVIENQLPIIEVNQSDSADDLV